MTTASPMPESTPATPKGEGFGARLREVPVRMWIALALVILAIVFIVQNKDTASVSLLFVTLSMPVWMLMAASVVTGLIIGLLLHRRSDKPGAKAAK